MGRFEELVKGKPILEFPDSYIVVDIETTGLDPVKDCIMEISAVKYRKNRKVDDYVVLINIDRRVPLHITELTGITNKMLEGGVEVTAALQGFIDFIGEDIVVGYNVPFDLAFLNQASERYLLRSIFNDYIDVMQIAMEKLPFLGRTKQIVVAKYFGIGTEGSHRALNDCEICNACYQKLKELSVPLYSMPDKQVLLEALPDAQGDKPFLGKKFLFIGCLYKWYIKNLMDVVEKLGGTVCSDASSSADIVVVGTADQAVLESKEFLRLIELKASSGEFALLKDGSFVKGLIARKFVSAL